MPHQKTFLVTEVEGETAILSTEDADSLDLTPESVAQLFGDKAYYLTLTLKDATFADQQRCLREAGSDETLLPQKRFVIGVEKIEKRVANQENTQIPNVTEEWFTALNPPMLANVLHAAVFAHWYPAGAKTADFFQTLRDRQSASATVKK